MRRMHRFVTMFLLGTCLAVCQPSLADAEPEKAADKPKKVTLASISVTEDYPEGVAAEGLFGNLKPHLRELIDRLDKAAKDEKISGVVLRLRDPQVGLGKVDEVRGHPPRAQGRKKSDRRRALC